MKNLKNPTSQITEVLHCLLTKNSITFSSVYKITGIINLTARLSNLRIDCGLDIPCVDVEFTNKFDRKSTYGSWKLTDKEHGLEVYNKLLKV